MLVVIGIIVVLIGIAVPALNRTYKNAVRTRMAADIQVISTALEAYRGDFKDYPRLDYSGGAVNGVNLNGINTPGSVILCWALLAPGNDAQDGADGLGFRTRSFATPSGTPAGQGQVYGPYIAPGRFNVANGSDDTQATINDRYGHPYLYFPARKGADATVSYCQAWSTGNTPVPMYNATDNVSLFAHQADAYGLQRLQSMLGDVGIGAGPGTPDGKISGTETAAYTGPYILWGAGPDEAYGPNFKSGTNAPPFDLGLCDDVTNFK